MFSWLWPRKDRPRGQPPTITEPLKPLQVKHGSKAVLEATVKGQPTPKVIWYHLEKEVVDSQEFVQEFDADTGRAVLTISEVFIDDKGLYRCVAINQHGQDETASYLTVEDLEVLEKSELRQAPRITHPLQSQIVKTASPLVLLAQYEAFPPPTVKWYHQGKELKPSRDYKIDQIEDETTLHIDEVYEDDTGEYEVKLFNEVGEARSVATVIVTPYEYLPDSEVATITSVSEKTIMSETQSEEEITETIEKDTDSDSEAGTSPYFVNRLEETIEVMEESTVRLITKVTGYPKPKVTWHADNQAVEVTENLTLETYEDGTQVLTIPKVTLDDCGTYTCEAMNRNGVDTTVTEVVVLQEHNEESKSYRKPEWVTRMEELKDAMSGVHTKPKFTQEIVDSRVKEMETITFTTTFAGNPKPEIAWYHNNKIIRQHASYQMRVRNDKAMLTIVQARPEMKGEYSCRAVNSEGEEFTRAKLDVIELTYEEKMRVDDERYAAVQIQHAAEHMKEKERERAVKQRQEHQEAMSRLKDEKVNRTVQREKELEDARKNVWKPKFEEKKVKLYNTKKERLVAEVYTNWKSQVAFEECYPEIQPNEFSPNQIPGVKCFVKVSETSVKGEEVVREVAPQFFEDEQIINELAQVHTLLKNNVKVNDIWAKFRAGEFKSLLQPRIQTALVKICEHIGHHRNVSIVLAQETQEQAKIHPVGLKAFLRMVKHAKNIKPDIIFKEIVPKEMGKFSSTTQELTKVCQMISQGVENEEIIACCQAGKLPSLKKPETQQPLINIVEKHGHSVMVAQVLVEEAYRDAKDERTLAEKAWEVVHDEETKETVEVSEITSETPQTLLTETTEQVTIQEHEADTLQLEPTPKPSEAAETTEEIRHTAESTQVHPEMCVPGFKSLIRLATDNQIDLETVELKPAERLLFEKDIAKLNFNLKRGVQVNELMTMMKEDEFVSLKKPSHQAQILEVVDRLEHATVHKVLVQEAADRSHQNIGLRSVIRTIETGKESMEQVIMDASKEFGPSSDPVREMAAVGYLLQEGVKCEEVVTLVESGLLSSLRMPESQMPLTSMVVEKGHIGSICEVLVGESVKEIPKVKPKEAAARMIEVKEILKKAKAETVNIKTFASEMVPGVKAYVRMAQEENVDIEEVLKTSNLEPKLKEEVAKIGMMVKHGVLAQDVITLMETGEFPQLMREEAQAQLLTVVEDFGFKVLINQVVTEQVEQAMQKTGKSIGVMSFMRMMQKANVNVEELLTEQLPKELSDLAVPVSQEMAKVSVMLKEGVQAQEIMAMVDAGELPNLKRPEAQMPLINVVEGLGHSALICQVMIEDSISDIIQELPKVDSATFTSVETFQSAQTTQVEVKEDVQMNIQVALQSPTEAMEIAPPLSVKPGDQLRATATYVSDNTQENAMHLVEGERVYIKESTNSDWWFVKKHLTLEEGYVPAKLLADDVSYTHYVQHKLEDKANKLPVFDKLKKGQKSMPPKIVTMLEPISAVDGQEAQFVCKIQGTPRPTVTWFRQTAIIKPSDEFQVFYSDDNTATLVVKEVFPEDAGMFTCIAKNQAGYSTTSAELVVEGPISDHGSESIITSRRSLSRESSVCDIMEGIPPTFAKKPCKKTVEEGTQVELDMRLVAIPEPEIVWKKDGQVLRDSQRIRIVKQKDVHAYRSIIIIKGARKDDEGTYEIFVKNREGEAKNTITLRVTAPETPVFEEKFPDQTVESEGTIRLVARIRGIPAPDVTWSRSGKKLKVEKNVVMTFQDELAVLEIRNVMPKEDTGKYSCTATNKVGKASHTANITVGADIVTFKRGLESCVVDENSEVILECRTSKEKKCKWLRGKTEIKTCETTVVEQEGLTHRLIIHSVTATDTGKFKCTFDDVSTFCNLTVRGLDDFVERVQDVEVQEREEAVLQVEVTSEKAIVTWHKDGEEITEYNTHFKLVTEGKTRRLVLKQATLSDEGEYTCVLGDQECTAELTVRELPAEIVKKMKDQVVNKGNRATMEVELTKGDAVITWFKDGKEIRFSDHYQLSIDGKIQRLLVYNCQVEDSGSYRAVVGHSECSATLRVELQEEGDFSKKLPAQMDVNYKADATFIVEITKEDFEVKWFRNGEEVKATERYVIKKEVHKRTLIVKHVNKDDAVEYSCVLANLKTTCKLNVIIMETAPRIEKEHQKMEVVVTKSKDATIKVPYTGTPIPNVTWTLKGQELNTDKSKKLVASITEKEATLTVKIVQNIDCGEYRLKLSNDCGTAYADITIKLLDKPSQPGAPDPMSVTDDSVTIHWTEPKDDGGRVIINYIVEFRTKKEQTWTVFNKVEKITKTTTIVTRLTRAEEYCFRVSAVNEIGTSEVSSASIFVKVCKPVTAEPPVVKEPLQAVVTGLHQEVVLCCVVTATPTPKIEWLKDGKTVSGVTHYENFTATFTIKKTMETSGGMYTCRASNEAGMAECSATVVIQEGPRFEYDEAQQVQRLSVGEKWHVPIQVIGHPRPNIRWTCNDKPITGTHVVIHTEESEGSTDIAIHKLTVEDSSVYTVTAENSAGKAQLSFNLRVVERPAAPMGPLETSDVGTTSVRLTWQPSPYDGGVEITSYYIERLESSQKQWQKVAEVGPEILSYMVQELLESHEYFFRVFAQNSIGVSDALEVSETLILKSPFDKPGPPLGPFDVSNVTESSLLLHWDEPDFDGGSAITHYILEKRETTKKAWTKVGQIDAPTTEYDVAGLKKGTAYYFRVYAYNAVGQGPPLQPDEPITAAPPSKPNNLQVIDVTTKTVTLAWAPPTTTGGADLMGYVIETRMTSERKWECVNTVDASVTLYCVENLREKSEYEFRVYAENPVGRSLEPAMTEFVRLKTHATPPSPPTAPLEVRPTGPTSMTIEWGAPESDGGAPLLGYIIAIRDIKRTMWIEVGQVGANFTKLHIKELQEEHEYYVRVFARNEVGASDPLETEEPIKIIRPDGFTELPEDDNAPSLSYSTTETLSWMREAGMDADIYSYARGRLLNRDEYFFKIWHRGIDKMGGGEN